MVKNREKEIIIIENGSSDDSAIKIKKLKDEFPNFKVLFNKENKGICRAFNDGFRHSKGKYLIDLSADDILHPEFAEESIKNLESRASDYGVSFSNVRYIDNNSDYLGVHFPVSGKISRLSFQAPEGDIYTDLLQKFIIKAPSMLMKRDVLVDLNGYDENLVYEDFDFWIRSSRKWNYAYLNEELVDVRIHAKNFSRRIMEKNNLSFDWSTFKVCMKARKLNKNEIENKALHKRCSYHLRQSVLTEKFRLAKMYYALIKDIDRPNMVDRFVFIMAILQLPIFPFYRIYIQNH